MIIFLFFQSETTYPYVIARSEASRSDVAIQPDPKRL